MNYAVLWTDEAKETFEIIVNMLEIKWGNLSASNFITTTQSKINLIISHPYLYKESISANVRQAVITKQTSMFYEIRGNHIIILFFMDNRQEPII